MSRKPNPTEGRRLREIVVSDPEIMGSTPVFRGTRIPADLIIDMLAQGAIAEEILEGYPTLDEERIGWRLCMRGRCQWGECQPHSVVRDKAGS